MIIERCREKGKVVNRPSDSCNKLEKLLFEHCSGGLKMVSTRRLNQTVMPLLMIHGIADVKIEYNDHTEDE